MLWSKLQVFLVYLRSILIYSKHHLEYKGPILSFESLHPLKACQGFLIAGEWINDDSLNYVRSKTFPSSCTQNSCNIRIWYCHSFVMSPPGHPDHLDTIVTHQEAQDCVLSESLDSLEYFHETSCDIGAQSRRGSLSHRDPDQHKPVLPETVSQVGDDISNLLLYQYPLSVSEVSADSPLTSSSSSRPEGSSSTSRWSLTPSFLS